MASPPLAEGGEPIAVPEKWTFIVGHLDAPTELDLSPCSESAAKLRDPRQLVWTASVAHLYATLPRRLRRRRTRAVGVPGDLWFMLWLLALMASAMGCTRGRALPYVLLCDRVTYPPIPFTYYGRGSSFSTGDVPAYLS